MTNLDPFSEFSRGMQQNSTDTHTQRSTSKKPLKMAKADQKSGFFGGFGGDSPLLLNRNVMFEV